jgi:hypothetical protein
VFSKLSKLLLQEHALSAPCSWIDFGSPQVRPRGAQECCGQAYSVTSNCHFTVGYTQVSMPARADAFPVGGGGCTGRAHRCKARQRRRGKTAPTFVSTFTVVRFLDGVDRGIGFLW